LSAESKQDAGQVPKQALETPSPCHHIHQSFYTNFQVQNVLN